MAVAPHPLDPLGPEELERAAVIARSERGLREEVRFALIGLEEPDKAEYRRWAAGGPRPVRCAEVQVVDPVERSAWRGVVDLDAKSVLRWVRIDAGQPPLCPSEYLLAINATKSHPGWQERMRARGIEDLGLVQIDAWSVGAYDHPRDRRLARCLAYLRQDRDDNPYAHPVDGLTAVVDVHDGTVLELIDEGIVPVPPRPGGYLGEAAVGPTRAGMKPLEISQPEGASFTLEGNEIRWLGWHIRFSLHQIEGLVLHAVGYEEDGRVRPILHRAGLSEMVVPYGDTSASTWWKTAFDAGEFGLGRLANSLELGCDCLGEITYADAWFADDTGRARKVANAVCLHEEDYGLLWKHTDYWTRHAESRRSRRLVLSSIVTVGNYDYGFFWYFYLDGTIQMEMKATGIVQTVVHQEEGPPPFGVRVTPELYAPHHQHFFCFRLDLDVDGERNTVLEANAEGVPEGPHNPHGNAFRLRLDPLRHEQEARREVNALTSRSWWVINPDKTNAVGDPLAYKLVPGPSSLPMAQGSASVSRRAGFAAHHLWVTPYRADERHAAGDTPNQHAGGDGLPRWTAQDRDLEETDVVLWHTVGITHIARPEDWPIMPVEYAGFSLKPQGFFDRNPSLDLPASTSAHCHGEPA